MSTYKALIEEVKRLEKMTKTARFMKAKRRALSLKTGIEARREEGKIVKETATLHPDIGFVADRVLILAAQARSSALDEVKP